MRFAALLLLGVAAAGCSSTSTAEGVDAKAENSITKSEVERRVAELRYLHGNELLNSLTYLVNLGDTAMPAIRAGARSDDWLTRASLAWVMGESRDRRYIPDLRLMLDDKTTGVRYEAGAALVELGDNAGFSALVEGLSDADVRNRYKCFESLRRATGRDFGYQHDGSEAARGDAVARWKDWLAGIRASAL
jgi:HEAT repeat protein